jgi:F-type H+-transporting ATPase subunit b
MEIISNIALISINETLFVQLISFLIFLFLINRIMFRPLGTVMHGRVDYMEGLKQSIVEADEEAIRLTNELAQKEAAARNDALAIKKKLEEEASDQAGGIYETVRNEIRQQKQETEQEVQSQIRKAQESLQAESEIIAIGIMEKILNRRVSS